MTCITLELLLFPCLSCHEPGARMLAPGSRDLRARGTAWARCAVRACVRRASYGERACQQDSGTTIYSGRPHLLLAVWGDMRSRVSPVPGPPGHTCSLPAQARARLGSRVPGVCKLWPGGAEHWCFHLTRTRGAAPLGGSSHSSGRRSRSSSHSGRIRSRSSRRLVSPWDLQGVQEATTEPGGASPAPSAGSWAASMGGGNVGSSCPHCLCFLVLWGAAV